MKEKMTTTNSAAAAATIAPVFASKSQASPPHTPKSSVHSPASSHERLKSTLSSLTKKNKVGDEGNKLLVMIFVMGSAGPLKMVVKEEDKVGDVVAAALKLYAREGRLPALGCKASQFELHCSHSGSGALDESKKIGACGSRSFLMCKKSQENNVDDSRIGGKLRKLRPMAYHLHNCFSF
ncbi:uncharacterized protein At4g22758-like [Nymphaea colorata]|nr:uncharacterized protein At4g22758-like [Nymphaea colorata]